jgi:hypothetical protein
MERLATVLSHVIKAHFWTSDELCRPSQEDGYEDAPTTFELGEIVMGIMKQDIDFRDELSEAIVEDENRRIQDGEPRFFDSGALYSATPEEELIDSFSLRWDAVIEEVKHRRRFFSASVREFFADIFDGVEYITAFETSPLIFGPVVREEQGGFPLYRSRIIDADVIESVRSDPFKHVGPAPKEKARSGRMSPEGVVALYCAREKDTAIAELRPAIGQVSAVIELRLSKKLRLLDFKRLERSLDDGWDALLDPKYLKASEARKFLRKLHTLISRPVVPGKEGDYLITQTMAEYLAHVYEPGFDGILFNSAQCAKGTNVVLFPSRSDGNAEFAVEYVTGSLAFYRTQQVAYSNSEIHRLNQLPLWENY